MTGKRTQFDQIEDDRNLIDWKIRICKLIGASEVTHSGRLSELSGLSGLR
jgi:hypothetical protein